MDKEKWNKVSAIVQEIRAKKWAQEMDDVEILIVNKTWRTQVGCYSWKTRKIFVSGNRDFAKIKRTILHELAHHIEYRHAQGFIRYKGVCHSTNFHTILAFITFNNANFSLKEITDKLYDYPRSRQGWVWNEAKTRLMFNRFS